MDDRITRTRATYDAIADRFLERSRDRSSMHAKLDRFAAALPPAALVLDVGAGPGFDSMQLRARGLRAIVVDLSIGMLRAGLRDFPGERVQADARRLPFCSASARGVWANASLLHLSPSEVAMALGEMHRVLSAGGVLHVSVKQGDGAGWKSDRYGEPRWFQYWTESQLDAALRAAGFRSEGAWLDETPRASWLVRLVRRTC